MVSRQQVFSLTIDVQYLRSFIVPNPYKNKGKLFPKAKLDCPTVANVYPLCWHRCLQKISRWYDAIYRIDLLAYDSIYNRDNKLIVLGGVVNEETHFTTYDVQKTFAHELAHRIQHMAINKAFGEIINRPIFDTTSQCLKYERAAERLSYYICKEYFPSSHKWDHRWFTSYRRKKDIKDLRKHWSIYLSKDDLSEN